MIISKTPFRMSFFGGGTDYPSWFKDNQTILLAAALDYYCYISIRKLPNFFDHTSKAVYSKIELVKDNYLFEHPSIRACLQAKSVTTGIELHHDSDIPARSGIGSSSSFTVGLLNALNEFTGQINTTHELAEGAIFVEQKLIGEPVGVQDQIIAAYGGLRKIQLGPSNHSKIESVNVCQDYLLYLQENIIMGFTGEYRNSADHSGKIVAKIKESIISNILKQITSISVEAIREFEKEQNIQVLGKYMHENWKLKKAISGTSISDEFSNLYDHCIKLGAHGGKLMGAGGGGAFYFFAPKKIHNRIKNDLSNIKVWLPVKFTNTGSAIIFNSNKIN
jgi:D-glycero-alpha-D-manno-heptose-7-phosphate kinase